MKSSSDLDLLVCAAREALDAHASGVLLGPALDVVAFERAARLAWRRDAARMLGPVVAGDAA
jgi:hypothetical protein